MSSGTFIIQNALSKIKAHSVLSPANPESIQTGKDELNGMIAEWEDDGIKTGAVPLAEPGSELSEPMGVRTAIINNLAVRLQPLFPASQIPVNLSALALKGYNKARLRWKEIVIPKPIARETLIKGQGNKDYLFTDPFFSEGSEIG